MELLSESSCFVQTHQWLSEWLYLPECKFLAGNKQGAAAVSCWGDNSARSTGGRDWVSCCIFQLLLLVQLLTHREPLGHLWSFLCGVTWAGECFSLYRREFVTNLSQMSLPSLMRLPLTRLCFGLWARWDLRLVPRNALFTWVASIFAGRLFLLYCDSYANLWITSISLDRFISHSVVSEFSKQKEQPAVVLWSVLSSTAASRW